MDCTVYEALCNSHEVSACPSAPTHCRHGTQNASLTGVPSRLCIGTGPGVGTKDVGKAKVLRSNHQDVTILVVGA